MGQLLDSLEDYYKILVYGRSGTGKTTLGLTAPKPLILLSERQGYRSVRDGARRLGIPCPPCIWVESIQDLRVALSYLRTDVENPIELILKDMGLPQIEDLPYAKPESVVLDSTTDIFKMVGIDIERTAGKKFGKDGLEVKPERFWGVLRDRCESLIRAFRDIPYHVVFLALLTDTEIGEGDEKSRVVTPRCPMKALPDELVAATNLCGIMSIREIAKKREDGELYYEHKRWVRFAGPSWMLTKALRPLRDVEVPHIGAWLETLRDGVETEPLDLGGYNPMADASLNQGDEFDEADVK